MVKCFFVKESGLSLVKVSGLSPTGCFFAALTVDCSTTSLQPEPSADAKTGAAATPAGRRNKGVTHFFLQ